MSVFACRTHNVTVEIAQQDGRELRRVSKALGATSGCVLQVGDGGRSAGESDLIRMASDGTDRIVAAGRGKVQVEIIVQTA